MKKALILLMAMMLIAPAMNARKKTSAKKVTTTAKTTAAKPAKQTKPYFIVISKKDLNLRVYKAVNGDTTLVQQFDACLSKNKGNKQRKGDTRITYW